MVALVYTFALAIQFVAPSFSPPDFWAEAQLQTFGLHSGS